jgi:hypothetical protein
LIHRLPKGKVQQFRDGSILRTHREQQRAGDEPEGLGMVTVDEVGFDLVGELEGHLADSNGVEHGQSS